MKRRNSKKDSMKDNTKGTTKMNNSKMDDNHKGSKSVKKAGQKNAVDMNGEKIDKKIN